jgi:Domain of unknown function (DUF932)
MYKFLTAAEENTSFVSDKTVLPKLDSKVIIEQFKLNTWEAQMAPNHKVEGVAVGKSNYVYRHNLIPSTDPNEVDGKVLHPYVTDKHQIVQFSEGAKWFDYFTQEGLLTIDSALILDESHFGITCDLGLEGTVQGEDTVTRYFILCLGHTKGTPRMLGFTDIRPICANTLVSSAMSSLSKAGQSFNLNSDPVAAMAAAKSMIDLTHRRFHEIELPAYKEFTRIKTTVDERELFYRKLLGMPLEGWDVSEKLLNQYQRLEEVYKSSPGMELFDSNEHSGWRLLQATTYGAKTIAGKTDWDKYRSQYGHNWVNKTYEWLEMRMDKNVAPVKSKLTPLENKVLVGV